MSHVLACEIKHWNYFKIISKLDNLRRFSQRRNPTPHFWGCAPRGLWPPDSNSAEICVQCTYPFTKFHRPMFTRSEVIVLTNKHTNKQTPLKTCNALHYADNFISHVTTNSKPDIISVLNTTWHYHIHSPRSSQHEHIPYDQSREFCTMAVACGCWITTVVCPGCW